MKILACFKIVPDLDLVAEEDWKADEELRVDTGYVRPIWNCFDESALEMMLKLSDLSEGFDVVYELSALTVGKKKDESFLKTLYALGYSHGIRIEKEDGCLFSIKETQDEDPVVFSLPSFGPEDEMPDYSGVRFDAEKWRSGTGAYFFSDCTAVSTDGHWGDYTVGVEAIS